MPEGRPFLFGGMRLDFEKMFERWQKESKERLKYLKRYFVRKRKRRKTKSMKKRGRDFGKDKKRKY